MSYPRFEHRSFLFPFLRKIGFASSSKHRIFLPLAGVFSMLFAACYARHQCHETTLRQRPAMRRPLAMRVPNSELSVVFALLLTTANGMQFYHWTTCSNIHCRVRNHQKHRPINAETADAPTKTHTAVCSPKRFFSQTHCIKNSSWITKFTVLIYQYSKFKKPRNEQ